MACLWAELTGAQSHCGTLTALLSEEEGGGVEVRMGEEAVRVREGGKE